MRIPGRTWPKLYLPSTTKGGFSPVQHALGQSSDEQRRLHTGRHAVLPDVLTESADGEFARTVARRAAAEKPHVDWTAPTAFASPDLSEPPCYDNDYQPGELVFLWRNEEVNKNQRQPEGKHGRFLGPARIWRRKPRDRRMAPSILEELYGWSEDATSSSAAQSNCDRLLEGKGLSRPCSWNPRRPALLTDWRKSREVISFRTFQPRS